MLEAPNHTKVGNNNGLVLVIDVIDKGIGFHG